MSKRIVVCSDGTGNTAVKDRGTNVFKVFEAVDLNGHRLDPSLTPQVAIYDDGVGTQDFKPLKIAGGAFGWGLSRNVKHLYRELARVYDPGDEIFMFGFSRGAFTVRTLAGFISTCGLIDKNKVTPWDVSGLKNAVEDAYRAYRQCYRPWLWRLFSKPTKDAATRFKARGFAIGPVPIRFIGVWDTVDAVGLPFHLADILNATLYQFKFPDHDLSSIVQRACQALSIDDPRETFLPQLWNEQAGETRITQVWFAGVHSNIGGGYPKQGMSLVPLDWMLAEAERAGEPFGEHGLRLNEVERLYFQQHGNVDDKLYNPRAGLGIFYRWKIRNIAKLCREHNVTPKLHLTALERIAHGSDDYAPGNLPSRADVVITRPTRYEDVQLALRRAAGAQSVLQQVPPSGLLSDVPVAIAMGWLSYYVYLFTLIATLFVLSGFRPRSPRDFLAGGVALGKFTWSLMTSLPSTLIGLVQSLVRNGPLLSFCVGGLALAYVMMLLADSRMDNVFSSFWFSRQERLRDAFKQARAETAAKVGSTPQRGVKRQE